MQEERRYDAHYNTCPWDHVCEPYTLPDPYTGISRPNIRCRPLSEAPGYYRMRARAEAMEREAHQWLNVYGSDNFRRRMANHPDESSSSSSSDGHESWNSNSRDNADHENAALMDISASLLVEHALSDAYAAADLGGHFDSQYKVELSAILRTTTSSIVLCQWGIDLATIFIAMKHILAQTCFPLRRVDIQRGDRIEFVGSLAGISNPSLLASISGTRLIEMP